MTGARRSSAARGSLQVGLVGLVLVSAFVATILQAVDGDATVFVGFGEEANDITSYAEARLGREVLTRPAQGHDGKFFFIQANDPWIGDPEENAALLEDPVYRSRRMLYPMLAGAVGLFSAGAVVWGLLVVNVVGMVLGTWGAARLALQMGGSRWLGLAFVLNVGLISALVVDVAGIVAMAAAIWAVTFLSEDRRGLAISLLAAAVLAREVMLVAAVGAAVWLWRDGRRRLAGVAVLVPAGVILAWEAYIRTRLEGSALTRGAVGWPFVGLVEAIPEWFGDPGAVLIGLATLLILVAFSVQCFKKPSLLGWVCAGFVPLALLSAERVWLDWFDYTRAVAPVITAFVIVAFSIGRGGEGSSLPLTVEEPSR